MGVEDLGLSNFNTEQVTSMYEVFDGTTQLRTLNVKSFDINKATSMGFMFYNVAASELDLSSFNISNVSNMEGMFDNTRELKKLV